MPLRYVTTATIITIVTIANIANIFNIAIIATISPNLVAIDHFIISFAFVLFSVFLFVFLVIIPGTVITTGSSFAPAWIIRD